jgi:hypothetical protein
MGAHSHINKELIAMKTCVFVLFAVVVVGLLAGCSGGTSTPAVDTSLVTLPAKSWFPMAIGDSWTYNVTADPSQLSPSGDKFVITADGTMTIPEKRTVGGFSWFVLRATTPLGTEDALARQTALGLMGKDTSETSVGEYAIKAPITLNNSWRGVGTGIYYKITGVNQTVKVPAGTFKGCIVVRMLDNTKSMQTLVTYKQGVGKIKAVTTKSGKLVIKWELKSYSLL